MINCPITKASIDEAECSVTVDVCEKDTVLSDRVKKSRKMERYLQ